MGADATGDVTVKSSEAFAGKKQIGIYFSAHWCPPCRGFTPMLTKAYKTKLKSQGFEVVFASSDSDRASCKTYFEEMGDWLVMPFGDPLIEKLKSKFKVQGIPTLVILDSSGEVVTTEGRDFIAGDKAFPFVRPTLEGCLGDTLLKKVDGKVQKVSAKDAIAGKTVALYFSGKWCGPCQAFTPLLIKAYNNLKKRAQDGGRKDDFEFVFVSSDQKQEEFDEYFDKMPWLAMPFSNREGKQDLSSMFKVRGIPNLIILDANRDIINDKTARGVAGADPEGLKFPWYPEPFNDINEVTEGLGEAVCVVTFLDGATPVEAVAMKENLAAVAKKYYDEARAKDTDPEFLFFYSTNAHGQISSQVRRLAQVGAGASTILLDLSDNGGYYVAEKQGDVEQLLAAFKSKTIPRKQAISM